MEIERGKADDDDYVQVSLKNGFPLQVLYRPLIL